MKILKEKCHISIPYLVISLLCFTSLDGVDGKAGDLVTCGSVLKLLNTHYKVRLHSHPVKYATGSEQQSVTGTTSQDDINSHWVIRGEAKKPCFRGQHVKCGSVVRLTHLATEMNLHSHYFSSPMSGEQEISAYRSAGDDDNGDRWIVLCDGEFWERNEEVMLKHVDTEAHLSLSGHRYGPPIEGDYEVVGVQRSDPARWRATEGLFIHPSEFNPKKNIRVEHTEL